MKWKLVREILVVVEVVKQVLQEEQRKMQPTVRVMSQEIKGKNLEEKKSLDTHIEKLIALSSLS